MTTEETLALQREKNDRLIELVESGQPIDPAWAARDRDNKLADRLKFIDVATLSDREFEAVARTLTGWTNTTDQRIVADILQRAGK